MRKYQQCKVHQLIKKRAFSITSAQSNKGPVITPGNLVATEIL